MNIEKLLMAPVLGAGIGYFTNYLAIKMLFKPHYPVKFLGVTVVRQGIIPAKRGAFARSIGNMVGNHLLTTEEIIKSLDNPAFQGKLNLAIKSIVDDMMRYDIVSVDSLIPDEFRPHWEQMTQAFEQELVRAVRRIVTDPEFAEKIKDFIDQATERVLAMDLAPLLSDQTIDNLAGFLDLRLADILASDDLDQRITQLIGGYVDQLTSSDRTLRSFIPEDIYSKISDKLNIELIEVIKKLSAYLQDEAFVDQAFHKAKQSLRGFMVKKSFFSRTIAEFTDNSDFLEDKLHRLINLAAAELSELILAPEVQTKILESFDTRIESWLDTSLEEVCANVSPENIDGVRDYIVDHSLRAIQSKEARDVIVSKVCEYLVVARGNKLEDLLGDQPELKGSYKEQIKSYLGAKVIEVTGGPMFDVLFVNMLSGQIDYLLKEKHIGPLVELIPAENVDKMYDTICQKVIDTLKDELPAVIDSIDIRQIVEDKVNSLDLPSLEKLLFDLLADQLAYINTMGGVLGAVIGAVNLLFV